MTNTGDLFSPEELRSHAPRWLAKSHSRRTRSAPGKKPDYEGDLAFIFRTQQRAPICMPEPHRQFHWAIELERNFRADFAFPLQRVLVEVQGGIWRPSGVGAHSGGIAIEKDIERAQYAARLGWVWLPVTAKDISSGHAVTVVQSVLERCGWKPGELKP